METPEIKKQANTADIPTKQTRNALLEIIENEKLEDIMLLLTVLSSYFVNNEKITKDKKTLFVNLLKGIFLNENTNDIKQIKKHINTYNIVKDKFSEILDDNGNLKTEKSIYELLEVVKDNFIESGEFRDDVVVHGEGQRLNKNVQGRVVKRKANNMDTLGKRRINSNFVFPPANYVKSIIDKLDNKLKDKNISVYKKAAYIASYVFLAHPFEDGNSRSSRILMVSYLDSLGKKNMRFFTFATNFMKELMNESYLNFLEKNVYSKYPTFRNEIEINDNGDIEKYLSLDEYEKIMEEVVIKLEKRLIKTYKNILENLSKIFLFLEFVMQYKKVLQGNSYEEKLMYKVFLENMFEYINTNGVDTLTSFINNFNFSKKFRKKNSDISEEKINIFLRNIKGSLKYES